MNNGLDLSFIMPILIAVILFIVAVLLIMVFYKSKKDKSLSIRSFETIMKTLDSINKMMKVIEYYGY